MTIYIYIYMWYPSQGPTFLKNSLTCIYIYIYTYIMINIHIYYTNIYTHIYIYIYMLPPPPRDLPFGCLSSACFAHLGLGGTISQLGPGPNETRTQYLSSGTGTKLGLDDPPQILTKRNFKYNFLCNVLYTY